MKSLFTFLLGAALAIGGLYLYHKFGPKESKTSYVLDLNITDGKRVPLKEGVTVEAFENQLQKVDPDGANGTSVNIKPSADSPDEVQGPLAGGAFKPPNSPIGPERSVHNTQKVAVATIEELQEVLAQLGSGSAQTPPAVSPPTPTPTP